MKISRLMFFILALLSDLVVFAGVEDNFNKLAEKYYQDTIMRSPMTLAHLGIKKRTDEWDDISQGSLKKLYKLNLNYQKKLRKIDRSKLSKSRQVSFDLLNWKMSRSLEYYEFRNEFYVLTSFRGFHSELPFFFSQMHQVENINDVKNFIKRVKRLKGYVNELIKSLKLREKKKIFLPKWSYAKVIETTENVMKGFPLDQGKEKIENVIYKTFKKKLTKLNLDEKTHHKFMNIIAISLKNFFIPSFTRLINELKRQEKLASNDDGVWKFARGKEYYQFLLKSYTTTNYTPEEIHQLGLENVKRIHNEMEQIKKSVNFEGSLQDFFKYLREDKRFYYENTDVGKKKYLQDTWTFINNVTKKLPQYFGLLPKMKLEVKRVEKYRESSAGKAFYNKGASDGSRPGIYYANLLDMKNMPNYQMEALIYHEALPGHHMQISIQQELQGVLSFQKQFGVSAYSEGWGLYAEWLGKYMGFYQDPYSDFGRLSMELYRAIRLVVDTGIHAKKWNKEKAIEYFLNNSPNALGEITAQIERYIVMPGQACSYMIGKIKIYELFLKSKNSLKEKFDPREFHDRILEDGPMPLDLLDQKINGWIASH